MLLAIRDRATGWIAWIIVILLIIPFALWGIQEYMGGGSEPVVASVDGHEITRNTLNQRYERVLRSMSERPEGAEAARLRRQVLDSMIADYVVVETARDEGMRIPSGEVNASIRQVEAFQVNGKFDQERYVQVLNANRLDPETFWAQQRRDLLRQQLLAAVGESTFVTNAEIDAFIRLRDRKVSLAYIEVPAAKFNESVEVSNDEIQKFYEANADQFKTPEQVKLKYLMLDPASLAAAVDVTDEQLRQMYAERKDSLFQPEQLQAAHILVAVPAGADEATVAAARERAQALRKRIADGEDFAAVAKQNSDDQASAVQGGDLGNITPGSREESFELALAELKEGQVSQPVRTSNGFELIKLVKRTPAGQPSFEQVRERLAQEYRRQQAEERYYRESETLYDLTYENPLTLDVAAKALDLQIQETGWISRDGSNDGLGAQSEVLDTAFSEESLGGGNLADGVNSKLIELKSANDDKQFNPVVVFRVADHRPAESKPLEQVRGQIENVLRQRKIREMTNAKAEDLLAQLRGGAQVEAVAKDAGFQVVQAGFVGRSDTTKPQSVVEQAFALGKPAPNETRYGVAPLPSGGMAVVAVNEVRDGDPAAMDQRQREFVKRLMMRAFGTVETGAVIDDMRARADISVNEEALSKGEEN